MPQHLKMFEWLFYGSIALDLVPLFLWQTIDIAFQFVKDGVLVGLVWAAARLSQTWAAWVLAFVLIVGMIQLTTMVSIFGGLWKVGVPTWISVSMPEKPPTAMENAIDVLQAVMQIAALYFYFFGKRREA